MVVVSLIAAVVTSCSTQPEESAASVSSSIPNAAQNQAPGDPLVLTAQKGQLTSVSVTANGKPVAGTLDPSGTKWSTNGPLDFGAKYQVQAKARDGKGRTTEPLNSSFKTAVPTETLAVERTWPAEGQTVGVAMPISIYFDKPVQDRAAVERNLSVEASVPTEGSFHWMSDERVNWRPKEFWKAGTDVTVKADLYGVDAGGGVMADRNFQTHFKIGRDQRSVGDVNAHTLTVYQDGKEIRTMPASFGRPVYPTQYGIHVASEKAESVRMRSDSWGGPARGQAGFYDEVLHNNVRISNNGEYIHSNPDTVGAQGSSNVSHGCVNLSTANGNWFMNFTQIGDPVDIRGSSRPLTPADGDISDWTIPWEEYVKGSALHEKP
ncbi:L,D-transpeptidase [Saccharopolyspora halophila]|uniref:L,D-transpeptidase n=1 Tax=Saccharopolyspora halophila TaxID=405551 RepID=UPI0031D0D510